MTGKIAPVLHTLAVMAAVWILAWGVLTLAGLAGRAAGMVDTYRSQAQQVTE